MDRYAPPVYILLQSALFYTRLGKHLNTLTKVTDVLGDTHTYTQD